MCRAGGRRCPGCQDPAGKSAHNARRRRARRIEAQILNWAKEQGADILSEAGGLSGPALRAWAEDHAAPAEVTTSPERVTAEEIAAFRQATGLTWASDELAGRAAWAADTQGDIPSEARLLAETPRTVVQLVSDESRDELSDPGSEPGGAGCNDVHQIRFNDGTIAYLKTFDGIDEETADLYGHDGEPLQPLHEVAAWRFAHGLGRPYSQMLPPVVLRKIDGMYGSLVEHRDGDRFLPSWDQQGTREQEQMRAAALFDCLTGQMDRHIGNVITKGRSMSLIDHGFAFSRLGSVPYNAAFWAARMRSARVFLDDSERRTLRRLLASTDTFGLEHILEPERCTAIRVRARRMLQLGRLTSPDGM